ncbi:hypothetical protein [Micromonospora sp. D93]|uniref:hypothetical protein n=1 Tax=Micromonospora sp. D93 TaxID=2824886 RepID=UPI0027DB466B|nr:hypothetical protein [Micromonospora sp. D93]
MDRRRPVAAVRYEVEPLDAAVELRVCSDLLANEKVPERSDGPRAASVPTDPLTAETYRATGLDRVLVHRTGRSGQRVAVAVSHLLEGPGTVTTTGDCTPDRVRLTVTGRLHRRERLRLTKFAAYEFHRATRVGLREHRRRRLPAAAALPVPGAVPQAGGQAGRSGAGHAALPR